MLSPNEISEIKEKLEANSQPVPFCGCIIWLGAGAGTGYGQVTIFKRSWYAHRLAFEVSNGPIPPGLCVMHKCDTRMCINPHHLTVGTHKENTRDMHSKGRGLAVMTYAMAKEVRLRVASGCSLTELAEELGISYFTLWNANSNRTWRDENYDAK